MKKDGVILIIDDDEDVLFTARTLLKSEFKKIVTINSPEGLFDSLASEQVDIIVLDMNFSPGQESGKEGLKWLNRIMKSEPDAHVIISTAYGDIDLAVESMKAGAIDFLVKPWEKEKLISTLRTVLQLKLARNKISVLEQKQRLIHSDTDRNFSEMISDSPLMSKVFETVKKVAVTDANVLILGENGTGKELIARAIHRSSLRAEKDFISVDLGTIAETIFESEMFGHARGAFTDAKEDRPGRFEIASGGTLFLDEIGNLSYAMQIKLLSALQNRRITRLGTNHEVPIDIRLVCATNIPVDELTNKKQFREDLLYRINTVEIQLPPLRERTDDIPLLAEHFTGIYKEKYNKRSINRINKEAMVKLKNYHWPGNIRELQHAVERAVILSEGSTIKASDFMIAGKTGKSSATDSRKMKDMEAKAIKSALIDCNGNQTLTAELLGYSRSTLYRKIKRYGL